MLSAVLALALVVGEWMPGNLILNGNAESAAPPPNLGTNASIVTGGAGDLPVAFEGSKVFQLIGRPDQLSGRMTWANAISTLPGRLYVVSGRSHPYQAHNGAAGPNEWDLAIRVASASTPVTTIRTVSASELTADEWAGLGLGSFIATDPLTMLQAILLDAGAVTIDQRWLVDSVVVVEYAVITKAVTDAVKADLGHISVANGYDTDVAVLTTADEDITKVATPGIVWRPAGSGDSNPDHLTNRTSRAVQRFDVALSALSLDALNNLLDDVRNCIERNTAGAFTGSTMTLATPKVMTAAVTSWDAAEYAGDRWIMKCNVEVVYDFARGSA